MPQIVQSQEVGESSVLHSHFRFQHLDLPVVVCHLLLQNLFLPSPEDLEVKKRSPVERHRFCNFINVSLILAKPFQSHPASQDVHRNLKALDRMRLFKSCAPLLQLSRDYNFINFFHLRLGLHFLLLPRLNVFSDVSNDSFSNFLLALPEQYLVKLLLLL